MNLPVQVFYSYASEDEEYRQQLEKHLSLLRRQGIISEWHNHKIVPGDESAKIVASYLDTSSLILLLVSPDFMASDYCYQIEMQHALQRQASGLAYVIPIILRPVDWQNAPFSALPCLPRNACPVTLWSNQDQAFHDIVLGIREAIDEIKASSSATLPPLLFKQDTRPKPTTHVDQNRQRFLKRIQATWISGVLERSLHDTALLVLGLHEQPDAVLNPWHLIMQETDQASHPLPPDTSISQVFDDANGELLILGEPGAGKTTLLLQLANSLLLRAERNPSYPMPVVLNLSSWAEKRPPLTTWIIDELNDKYAVPRTLAAAWLASDQMLLLLDGLDEVALPYRSACIAALNLYRQEHNLTSIAVCSRSIEYTSQSARLSLQKAVRIQPLTLQQINTYLSSGGPQLSTIHAALQNDEGLRDLATTPLMLNILMLTYQERTPDNLAILSSTGLRRDKVFEHYVQHMLERRAYEKRYSSHQTVVWLASLAKHMKRHGQTEFYIERMQKNWLVDHKLRLLYHVSFTLICILIGAIVSFIVAGLSIGLTIGLLSAAGFGVATGLMAGLETQIRTTTAFVWSWKVLRLHWLLLVVLTLTGYILGVVDGNPKYAVLNVVGGILFGGLVGVLVMVLFNGQLSQVVPDTQHIVVPNQEMKRSFLHSLVVVLVCMPFEAIFILLHNRTGIIGVLGLGLGGALGFGGLACIQHVVLRFLLWRTGQLPWRLPQFLDYAAERILLRKVGGGYIFIHRLLLEYFARLDTHGDVEDAKNLEN